MITICRDTYSSVAINATPHRSEADNNWNSICRQVFLAVAGGLVRQEFDHQVSEQLRAYRQELTSEHPNSERTYVPFSCLTINEHSAASHQLTAEPGDRIQGTQHEICSANNCETYYLITCTDLRLPIQLQDVSSGDISTLQWILPQCSSQIGVILIKTIHLSSPKTQMNTSMMETGV